MSRNISITLTIFLIILSTMFFTSTFTNKKDEGKVNYNLSKEFKEYWFKGKAELTSYDLKKARYGEIHNGEAVLIFVVEPFLLEKQVKNDGVKTNEKSEQVMKLINSQKFYTGIYPYSIMTSSFYALNKNKEGIVKLSMSSQDWCGQIYSQINNRDKYFELKRFSYFQKDGDLDKQIVKGLLEEEIFTKIRLNPNELPIGNILIYPSSEYIRLTHKTFKQYEAFASIEQDTNKNISIYRIKYEDIERDLAIIFENEAPFKIVSWNETYKDISGKILTSSAKLKKNIKLDYWRYNSISDSTYRDLLSLKH